MEAESKGSGQAGKKKRVRKPLTSEQLARARDRQREYRKLNGERPRTDEQRQRRNQWSRENRKPLTPEQRERRAVYLRDYYKRNREEITRKREEYYRATRPERLSAMREYQRRAPHKKKEHRLQSAYGLTTIQVEDMIAAQGGRCAICDRGEPRVVREFPVIDHCHVTGRVRGILCSSCNGALGLLRDSPYLCERAIAYLRAHGAAEGHPGLALSERAKEIAASDQPTLFDHVA